jgi:hypothetical protein
MIGRTATDYVSWIAWRDSSRGILPLGLDAAAVVAAKQPLAAPIEVSTVDWMFISHIMARTYFILGMEP